MTQDSFAQNPDLAAQPAPSPRMLAFRTVTGLILLFGAMALGAWALKDPLTTLGQWFFTHYGLPGAFIGTILCDAFAVPVPVDTYLAAAVTAKVPALPILTVASLASLLGGAIAYKIGQHLHRIPILQRIMERFRPKGEALFTRWGSTAVAIAAWTPVPFAIVCWMAGTFKMPWTRFALATLHRIPRIILYYYIIKLGWFVGS